MICAAGPVGFNKGVDEIFNENLKIIKNNWIKADGTPDKDLARKEGTHYFSPP
jgi:hypothetical protein